MFDHGLPSIQRSSRQPSAISHIEGAVKEALYRLPLRWLLFNYYGVCQLQQFWTVFVCYPGAFELLIFSGNSRPLAVYHYVFNFISYVTTSYQVVAYQFLPFFLYIFPVHQKDRYV